MSSAEKSKAKAKATGATKGDMKSDKSDKKNSSTKAYTGFSAAERKAMQDRAKELELEAGQGKLKGKAKMEKELLDKIAEMPEPDRSVAERIHALAQEHAPDLTPKTMYGMPGYANADGKVVFFFQAASKWDSRYATLAFQEFANLDDGTMWPTSFALTELNKANEKRIVELKKKAVA